LRLGTSLYNQTEGNCAETSHGIYGRADPDISDHVRCPGYALRYLTAINKSAW